MKWIITGGSGFTGSHLVSLIQEKFPDDKMLILDIKSPNYRLPSNCKYINVDLVKEKKIEAILDKEIPDRIVHLAGLMKHENLLLLTKINVLSCNILLNAVKKCKIALDGFLVIGSVAQYGKANPQCPPTENDICVPSTLYGHLKLVQEKIALHYYKNHDIPVMCIRPANLIGPLMPPIFVIPRILDQLIEIKRNFSRNSNNILKLFHMNAGRDFIDVRDVVSVYTQIFDNPKTRGEVFNLGTNQLTYLKDIINKAKEVLGIDDLTIIEEKPRKEFDLHITNSHKIRNFITWNQEYNLEKSLQDSIRIANQK